ncbi:MAG: hypothetical protein E5V74_08595 [Mesorhizobium sp.]|nr:MAG: hypothetical protein E5V74_08595 [Mesorhizobium sp.]
MTLNTASKGAGRALGPTAGLVVLTQFRTENRYTLFLELLQDHRHAGRRLAAGSRRWQIAAELIPSR